MKSSLPTTPLYLTRSIFHLKSVSSSSSVPEFHKLAKSELKIFIRKSKMFLKQVLVTCFLWTLVNSCTTTEKPNNGSGIQKRQVVCGNEGPQYCEGTIEFIPSILRRKIFRYIFSIHYLFKTMQWRPNPQRIVFKWFREKQQNMYFMNHSLNEGNSKLFISNRRITFYTSLSNS